MSEVRLGTVGSDQAIISVENKETFCALARHLKLKQPPGFRLPETTLSAGVVGLVYTAGHPNGAVVELLRAIVREGTYLYHFGDLDPDGLLIVAELSALVGIEIAPVLMNLETYQRYFQYGYPLGDGAIGRLRSARDRLPSALLPLADVLSEQRIGVEQEVIDFEPTQRE